MADFVARYRDTEAFGADEFVDPCKQRIDLFADIISQQSIRSGYRMGRNGSYHTKPD